MKETKVIQKSESTNQLSVLRHSVRWSLSGLGHFLSWVTFCPGMLSVLVYTFCFWTLSVLGHFLILDTFCPWTLYSVATFYSLTLPGLAQILFWDSFCLGTLSVLRHFLSFLAQPIFSISLVCLTKIDNRAHHLC